VPAAAAASRGALVVLGLATGAAAHLEISADLLRGSPKCGSIERTAGSDENPAHASVSRALTQFQAEIQMRNTVRSFVAAATVGSATLGASAQQAVQWRVEDGGNGHWYAFNADLAQWSEARQRAIARGGDLVSLESSAELNWFRNQAWCTSGLKIHLGGVQDAAASSLTSGWRWLTGSAVNLDVPLEMDDSPCTQACCIEDGQQQLLHLLAGCSALGDVNNGPTANCPEDRSAHAFVIEWSADCNNDGIVDYGQILDGQVADANDNGVPDMCETTSCTGDVVRDGEVNGVDIAAVLSQWGTAGGSSNIGDVDGDGVVSGPDLAFELSGWGACSSVPTWAVLTEYLPDPLVVTDPVSDSRFLTFTLETVS
jgi:hypothetical protein